MRGCATWLPRIRVIYDRRKKASSTHMGMLEVCIQYDKQTKWMSTGICLYPREIRNGVVVNRRDALQLNEFLEKFVIDIRKVINEMVDEHRIDIFSIPERLKRLRIKEVDIYPFFEERVKLRTYGKDLHTKRRYESFLVFLQKWGGIKKLEDLNEAKIIEMDEFLKSKRMKDVSRWTNYHRFLNTLIIDAINEGYIHKNPYKWVKIRKGDERAGISRHLTPGEFNAIKSAAMPTESLERVRDLFIFQTYSCLSYKDLADFSAKDITVVNGKKVYTGKRKKTGIPFTIPLLPPALEVLEKYKGKLPIISNVKYNLYLKDVAAVAHVDKPVTSHWARHTGATMLLNSGVSMQVVSRICGHASIKMTEKTYAALLDETVVEAVKDIQE